MMKLRRIACGLLVSGLLACPFAGRAGAASRSDSARTYHLGLTTVRVRHLDVVGLGMFGVYGDWSGSSSVVNWGGEVMLLHSGERRIPRLKAYNPAYSDTVYRSISHVYEQVSSIAIGASAFRVLRPPPEEWGLALPGVTLGVAAGIAFETDRVGLQSSDLDLYYGVSAPSNTDVYFSGYIRPQLVLSQGSISVVAGIAFLPEFASWSVGVAYGW